jgi:hypothetical protein
MDDVLRLVEGGVAVEGMAEDGLVPVDIHGDGVDAPFHESRVISVDADVNGCVQVAALENIGCD